MSLLLFERYSHTLTFFLFINERRLIYLFLFSYLNMICEQESGIKISNIIYKDIVGTSATPIAIKFDCSSKNPCNGIRLEDVRLTYQNEEAKSSCEYAKGKAIGLVQPDGCFV